MKVAFQISGILRNWETAYVLFSQYKKLIEKKGLEVDFFIHTWDDEYARLCIAEGLFDIFTDYELTPLPRQGIEDKTRDRSKSLYSWSYSMFLSSVVRRSYQYNNKVNYIKVFSCRPDIYVPYRYWSYVSSKMALESSYMLNYPPYRKSATNNDKWPHLVSDDLKIVGTQEAIDLFSLNFHLMYLNNDPSFIPTYHTVPGLTIMRYGLNYESKSGLAEKWKILRRNDGKSVMSGHNSDDVMIEQEYLRDGMMQKYIERFGL